MFNYAFVVYINGNGVLMFVFHHYVELSKSTRSQYFFYVKLCALTDPVLFTT
jgi:hypothetical protein